MHFIAHMGPRGNPRYSSSDAGTTLTCTPTSTSVYDAATADTTTTAAAAAASPTDQSRQSIWKERSHIPPTPHIKDYGFYGNGTVAPGALTPYEDNIVTHQFRYRDHILDTSNISVVAGM